jgi:hypothetical protein
MSPLAVKHRHDAARNLPPGSTSRAQTELAAALERLLEPLEKLQEEDFQSEPSWPARTILPAKHARLRHRISLGPIFWWLRVLPGRVGRSPRSPYRQIRAALWFGAIMFVAIVSIWSIEHMS